MPLDRARPDKFEIRAVWGRGGPGVKPFSLGHLTSMGLSTQQTTLVMQQPYLTLFMTLELQINTAVDKAEKLDKLAINGI